MQGQDKYKMPTMEYSMCLLTQYLVGKVVGQWTVGYVVIDEFS